MIHDIWRTTNFWGMIGLVLILAYELRGQFMVSAVWIYFLIRALFVFENTETQFQEISLRLDQTSGQAFAQLMLIPAAVFCIPDKAFKHWRKAFTVFGIINAGLLIFNGYGFMNASSFDAAMLAVLLPFVPVFAAVLFSVAILTSAHCASALLIIFSMSMVFMLHRESKKNERIWAGLISGSMVFSALGLQGAHQMTSSGRFDAWANFFQWWGLYASKTFGTGTGTFQWLGPFIGPQAGQTFLHMHNDWLQILFEGGAVGLILSAVAFSFLLWKSFYRRDLFCGMVGIGVFAMTYHPLRFFPSALFIAILVREVLEGD